MEIHGNHGAQHTLILPQSPLTYKTQHTLILPQSADNNLFNSKVKSIQAVQRPLDYPVLSKGIWHSGNLVTLENGEKVAVPTRSQLKRVHSKNNISLPQLDFRC